MARLGCATDVVVVESVVESGFIFVVFRGRGDGVRECFGVIEVERVDDGVGVVDEVLEGVCVVSVSMKCCTNFVNLWFTPIK